MSAPAEIAALVARFEENRSAYISGHYNETQVRHEFIDPFFKALGWDVNNEQGYAEAYKDLIHEDSIKVGGATKAPDYCFRIGGTRKFFLEAKRPGVNIKDNADAAFQIRRYAWSSKLPLSILTDFEEFAVYDCRIKPAKTDKASTARTFNLKYTDYLARWDEIASIFSRDAILKGSFDKYADSTKAKKGTAEVDDAFLKDISSYREDLAHNLALRNPGLTRRELNFAVQRIIDRIIFLRICEDRGIEEYGRLMALQNGTHVYERLGVLFQRADERYNSGLFHFHKEKGRLEPPDELTPGLILDDKPLKDIFKNLYYPDSPYEFSVLPADILGQVYEQFLGKVIRLTEGHRAVIEDKPEVKKAGGVYYTPTYIVDYIVQQTVGQLLAGRRPGPRGSASQLRILDPACGSGSFLIAAYQYLLDWHRDQYVADGTEKHRRELYQGPGGDWRLTTNERQRILLNNIYGVDIDPQAVETTKLSLLLKVLEGESGQSITRQLAMFHERALPDLADNIKCGNSLIGPDFYDGRMSSLFDEEETYRINVFDWAAAFPNVLQGERGGFDIILGNPPYLKIEHIDPEDREYFFRKYKACQRRFDTYGLFVEEAASLLTDGGLFGMIIPSTILNNLSFANLRKLLLESTSIYTIVNLGGRVFPGVNNDTLILCFAKGLSRSAETSVFDVAQYGSGLAGAELTSRVDLQRVAQPPTFAFEVRRSATSDSLISKMSQVSLRLSEVCTCFQGFVTGGNAAYIVDLTTIQALALETEVCKPAVFGHGIPRYGRPRSDSFVIYLTRDSDLTLYPRVKTRLEQYKSKLQEKREVRLGRQPWFALHWPRIESNFTRSPKLLVQAIRNLSLKRRVVATLDTDGLYADHTLNVLYTIAGTRYDIRYVLGVLNSTVVNYLFSKRYVDINIKGVYLSEMPLPATDFSNRESILRHDQLVDLVQHILVLHEQLVNARTDYARTVIEGQVSVADKQLDRLVYSLYGLTDEEIAVVEGATSVW